MPNGKIEIAWGDGDHAFNIAKIGQALELEEKCGAGVMEILTRLREGRWRVNDIRETVRLGLIGGGKNPQEALALTKRYVDDRPWEENVRVAFTILVAAVVGVPGDEVGKKEVTEGEQKIQTGASPVPSSTVSAPSSGGPRAKSTKSRSGNSRPRSTGTTKRTGVNRNLSA